MEKLSTATQKYIRISPSKMNQVMKEIRGKNVSEALNIIKFTNKKACFYINKLLNSAIANAVNNHEMDVDRLYISELFSNPGPILKRIQPAPMGRAYRINKRSCHNTVILKEREQKVLPKKLAKNTEESKPAAKKAKKTTKKAEVSKEEN
jgi:large subunit ribosomal protein L22